MGKYNSILILANVMGVDDEEFEEAASQLDAKGLLKLDGSLTPMQITDMILEQIKHTRFMKSLKKGAIKLKLKGVRSMPIVVVFLIALTLW